MLNRGSILCWLHLEIWVVVILASIIPASGQETTVPRGMVGGAENQCASRTSCSECVSAGPQCAWCKGKMANLDGSLDRRRCDLVDRLVTKCNDIHHPKYQPVITQNLPFGKSRSREIVQLRPQRVQVKITPNTPQRITVHYQQADDYPVDLYYLMDLSYSMNDDKTKLEALGEEIGRTMGDITSNFQLGFGSFVDKQVAPYVEEFPKKLANPCGSASPCAPPYGFVNHMRLSTNAKEFAKQVRLSNISGNLDAPEGGLDAIMQAMVCTNEIGWRDQARKIILVATDEGFHLAGDGKLGGVVAPNDGFCHLNSKGEYTESINQDYPSIGHINFKAKQQKINVIFAVTSAVHNIYNELTDYIEGSYSGKLSHDSSNVVDLIRDRYKEISSSVTLKDNATGDVSLTYNPNCKTTGARSAAEKPQTDKGSTCRDLKVGMTVSFDVDVEVSSCPRYAKDRRQSVLVYPVGINESLVIDVDIQCECDCGSKSEHSPLCSNLGTLECGTCTCPESRTGLACQCDSTRVNVSETDDTPCKAPNSSIPCTGRGTCICGLCACNEPPNPDYKIYGTFCEFDNFNCQREGGEICGGAGRGECIGGADSRCVCKKGWTGEACSCPDHDRDCVGQDGTICSGKGECKCGICDCHEKTTFGTKHCEDWIPQAQCNQDTRNCVLCAVLPERAEEERLPCFNCNITVEVNVTDDGRHEQKCELYKDENSCYQFYFQEQTVPAEDGRIRFKSEKECPKPVNAFLIGGTIVGAILGIGIALLLIWKILTTLHDRREFAKFEQDRQAAKWEKGLNPIYRQPVATFSNPMYSDSAEAECNIKE